PEATPSLLFTDSRKYVLLEPISPLVLSPITSIVPILSPAGIVTVESKVYVPAVVGGYSVVLSIAISTTSKVLSVEDTSDAKTSIVVDLVVPALIPLMFLFFVVNPTTGILSVSYSSYFSQDAATTAKDKMRIRNLIFFILRIVRQINNLGSVVVVDSDSRRLLLVELAIGI